MNDPLKPLTPDQTAQEIKADKHEGYIHRVLRQFDELANAIIGGKEDDTISETLAREDIEDKGIKGEIGKAGSTVLADIDPDHGVRALESGIVQADAEAQRDQQALDSLEKEEK